MNKSLLLLIFFVSLLHVSPIRNSVLISNGYSLFGSFDDPLPPIHVENWHLDRIQASEAMAISNGFGSFSVGFVDSGVDGTITDLSSNLNSILSIDCYGNHSRNPLSQTNSHGTSLLVCLVQRVIMTVQLLALPRSLQWLF